MFGLFKTTRERVADLETAVRQLQGTVRSLTDEWASFHDMASRRAARDRKRERDESTVPSGQPAGASDAPSATDPRAARALKRASLYQRIAERHSNGLRG